jgi:hypothetical protein
VIRPNETPFSWKDLKRRDAGWWLMKQLEDARFTPGVEVRSVKGAVSAVSLDGLVSNMMAFKDMFWKGYSEEEIGKAELVLKEQIRGWIRIGRRRMGWKLGRLLRLVWGGNRLLAMGLENVDPWMLQDRRKAEDRSMKYLY